MNRHVAIAAVWLACISAPARAAENAAPVSVLRLEDTENSLLESSERYQAAVKEEQAAVFRAAAQDAQRYPRLALEGSYRYAAVVPELTPLFPGARPQKLGDNTNYSLGPAAYWTFWDHGALRYAAMSAQAAARARRQDTLAVKRQVLLSGRINYLQVALRAEQVGHLAEAVDLARRQYDDIAVRARAGDKGRLDLLSARQELLVRQRQLSQTRADLAGALRDLAALSGNRFSDGVSRPLDSRVPSAVARTLPPATVTVSVEPLGALMSRMAAYAAGKISATHPSVSGPASMADYAELAAGSVSSGLWPKLQLTAKSSLEYPNGPNIESYYQNTVGASLNWPLFEAGASRNLAADNRSMREAYLRRAGQALTDLQRDWDKTQDQLANLKYQEELGIQSVAEAAEAARIAYDAYRAGARTFLEVQNTNFRLLDARLQLAQLRVQMLSNYAVAASLVD